MVVDTINPVNSTEISLYPKHNLGCMRNMENGNILPSFISFVYPINRILGQCDIVPQNKTHETRALEGNRHVVRGFLLTITSRVVAS